MTIALAAAQLVADDIAVSQPGNPVLENEGQRDMVFVFRVCGVRLAYVSSYDNSARHVYVVQSYGRNSINLVRLGEQFAPCLQYGIPTAPLLSSRF